MDLHVASPDGAIDAQSGVEEVGACVSVVDAWADHFEALAVGGEPFCLAIELVFPHVLKDSLVHCCNCFSFWSRKSNVRRRPACAECRL